MSITATSSRPTSLTGHAGPSPNRPTGAELAKTLKVGDQVLPAPGCWLWKQSWFQKRSNKQGTVTAVPSQCLTEMSQDPKGWVDVRWQGEDVPSWHKMGADDQYELELV